MNKRLNAVITIGGTMTGALKSALGTTQTKLNQVGEAIRGIEREKRRLDASGVFKLHGTEAAARATAQYKRLTNQVIALRHEQQRLQAVEANQARRGQLRAGVVDAVAIGATAAAPLVQAAKFETAMLGVAKQVDGARDKSGELTAGYHEMAKAIQLLGREIPIATNEIADMVTAGARMGIGKGLAPDDARAQLIGFTRNAAMMAEAFELPAGELADSMGKIAGLFKIPIPAIGELADSINWLDDNAISKGADIIDFLTRTGGVAASVRVTGQEMAALGSTLLTLGERTETASTATNAMLQKLAAADKGTKKFKAAMREVGLSTSAVQKGMQKDAQDTLLQVLEAVNKLPEDKRLGVMVELVGLEHSDTMAKLAANVGEYRRQIDLANSSEAKGSMSREFEARRKTAAAQWKMLGNTVTELSVNIGTVLLPAVNSVMAAIVPVTTAMADFAREHPTLTAAIAGTAVVIGGLVVGATALGYAFTFIRGGLLAARGLFAALGPVAGFLGRTALPMVGNAIMFIGRALFLNPIGLAIGAIAGAAYLIWKNWEPLKAWFTGLWEGIKKTFAAVYDWIVGKVAYLMELPAKIKDKVAGLFDGNSGIQSGGYDALGNYTGGSDAPAVPTPAAPAVPSSARRGGATVQVQREGDTYHITQQPGQDAKELAAEISRLQRQRASTDKRGALHDSMEGMAWAL